MVDHFSPSSFTASQSDVVLFSAIKSAPASNLANALRWYNHIKSFGDAKSKLPGVKKPLADYGVTGGSVAPSSKPTDDDDDVDLFGSDDEVDEEAEKLKKERLEAYAAKKSKSKFIYLPFVAYLNFNLPLNRTWTNCQIQCYP